MESDWQTFSNPISSIKPIIIGTAVKTPICTKNWVFRAASNAVLPDILACLAIDSSSPEKAWLNWKQVNKTIVTQEE